MTYQPEETQRLVGIQRPRICTVPDFSYSLGSEAVDFAAQSGLKLDPWQAYALEQSLGVRGDGRWSAFEIGLIVSRQNGKGSVLEARELTGLFLFRERLILHSAHEFKTAQEQFLRVKALVDNTDALRRRVKTIRTSHGEEGIELLTGERLRFVARSRTSGRGFTGDVIVLDEAFELPEPAMAALLPTLSARPNPQIWYTSSAVDQESQQHCRVLARVRERALGESSRLAYLEWSADDTGLDDASRAAMRRSPEAWAQANPGLGIRIDPEFVQSELESLPPKGFDVERLGLGDWPSANNDLGVLGELWPLREHRESEPSDPVAFAVDATPDRAMASIAVGARRSDGKLHGELVEHRRGLAWVPDRLAELVNNWQTCAVVLDPTGPAGSLLPALAERGIVTHCRCHGEQGVQTVSGREMTQACGGFYDAIAEDEFRHLGQPDLNRAFYGARKRPLGDAWAWHRINSAADISPLVAVTLACYGFSVHGPKGSYDVLESIW